MNSRYSQRFSSLGSARIPDYELVQRIYKGPYSRVYVAKRHGSDQLQALKMLQRSSRTECIEHEIDVLKKLDRQFPGDGFVKIMDHGKFSENGVYMVT